MKKTIYLLLLSFFVFVSCSNDEHILEEQSFDQKELKKASENSQGKIYVCHKGNIINVSINSLKAHIEHGDAIDMDGDGYFDTWHISGVESIPGTTIFIYDRFGKQITYLTSTSRGWAGTYNGRKMPATDYWFVAEVVKGGISFKLKGHFALRR